MQLPRPVWRIADVEPSQHNTPKRSLTKGTTDVALNQHNQEIQREGASAVLACDELASPDHWNLQGDVQVQVTTAMPLSQFVPGLAVCVPECHPEASDKHHFLGFDDESYLCSPDDRQKLSRPVRIHPELDVLHEEDHACYQRGEPSFTVVLAAQYHWQSCRQSANNWRHSLAFADCTPNGQQPYH